MLVVTVSVVVDWVIQQGSLGNMILFIMLTNMLSGQHCLPHVTKFLHCNKMIYGVTEGPGQSPTDNQMYTHSYLVLLNLFSRLSHQYNIEFCILCYFIIYEGIFH